MNTEPNLPGYRLAKLELYNWGTFDQTVHTFEPRGATSLIVGENGAGKSTLIDALLTLLVERRTRNYNFAAGAKKNERDERSYIRGAFDKKADEDGKPEVSYLRPGHHHYTALLVVFANQQTGKVFTVCQVLYLTPNNDVKSLYAFDESERSIAADLGELQAGPQMKATLTDRGFRTTDSFTQYQAWIRRIVKFLPKAMDVFNQTVFVRDVSQLGEFIRRHMLEKKPWSDKVSSLLEHFAQLSEAHRALVQIQQQFDLLQPILRSGERFTETASRLADTRNQQLATELFFESATFDLLSPLCEQWKLRIQHINEEIEIVEGDLRQKRSVIAKLDHDIENAGSSRLKQLPNLIKHEQQVADSKRDRRLRLETMLGKANIKVPLTSAQQLEAVHVQIAANIKTLSAQRDTDRTELSNLQYRVGELRQLVAADRNELESLRKRKGNLPQHVIETRDGLCHSLRLSPTDVPFVAELVAVKPEFREWEGSIEQVLSGFARTLLVPEEFYSLASGYIDRERLTDASGRGQRLTYNRIGAPRDLSRQPSTGLSLADMLAYRNDHAVTPYVRAEILARFNYLACDTVEQFQRAGEAAMTINRHIKHSHTRHEKDDRAGKDDRRNFVLGWENREKKLALDTAIKQNAELLVQIEQLAQRKQLSTEHAATLISALDEAKLVTDFDTVDDHRHNFQASQYEIERQSLERELEQSNNQVAVLKAQRAHVEAEVTGLQNDRDKLAEERTLKTRELQTGENRCLAATKKLSTAQTDGRLEKVSSQFKVIQSRLAASPLTLENITTLPLKFSNELLAEVRDLEDRLDPIRDELSKAMQKLLTKFPALQTDHDPTPQALPGFIALEERIRKDDLPRHEQRFKKRLNEKVLQEVGVLNSSLENERDEIKSKIESLNKALRRLEWREGTFMRLEPTDTKDEEIRDFRRDLANCLSDTLSGTSEANEATFKRIEKLVEKLRDESNLRWREKVIDVRNWFNFSAREYNGQTNEPGSYYDGGSGQSGGEKGKLAFFVLVASIAYQYDIEPDSPNSDRFHFVMVDEMFSRSDDTRARAALDLFKRFGLQLAIVAPLDAKACVAEEHVGMYVHVTNDPKTHRSELISLTAEQYRKIQADVEVEDAVEPVGEILPG